MKKFKSPATAVSSFLVGILMLVFSNATTPLVFVTVFIILVAFVSKFIVSLLDGEHFVMEEGETFGVTLFLYFLWLLQFVVFVGILVYIVSRFLETKLPLLKPLIG